jgi:hypothetical protein
MLLLLLLLVAAAVVVWRVGRDLIADDSSSWSSSTRTFSRAAFFHMKDRDDYDDDDGK